MIDPRRHELLCRRRRDALQELELLDAGRLFHPLAEDEYRGVLFETLEDIEAELSGEEYGREDD